MKNSNISFLSLVLVSIIGLTSSCKKHELITPDRADLTNSYEVTFIDNSTTWNVEGNLLQLNGDNLTIGQVVMGDDNRSWTYEGPVYNGSYTGFSWENNGNITINWGCGLTTTDTTIQVIHDTTHVFHDSLRTVFTRQTPSHDFRPLAGAPNEGTGLDLLGYGKVDSSEIRIGLMYHGPINYGGQNLIAELVDTIGSQLTLKLHDPILGEYVQMIMDKDAGNNSKTVYHRLHQDGLLGGSYFPYSLTSASAGPLGSLDGYSNSIAFRTNDDAPKVWLNSWAPAGTQATGFIILPNDGRDVWVRGFGPTHGGTWTQLY